MSQYRKASFKGYQDNNQSQSPHRYMSMSAALHGSAERKSRNHGTGTGTG